MSAVDPAELATLRAEALSAALRGEFAASARTTAAWSRAHPLDLDAILDWIDQLRALLGDAPAQRRPWRGSDFRL